MRTPAPVRGDKENKKTSTNVIRRRTPTSPEPPCRYPNKAGTAYGVTKHSLGDLMTDFTLSQKVRR